MNEKEAQGQARTQGTSATQLSLASGNSKDNMREQHQQATQTAASTASKMKEFDKLRESLEYIKKKTSIQPKVGIVCGSGLGDLVNIIENQIAIPYTEIPHFPKSTVVGHSGELVLGKVDSLPIVCMRGRVHLYEGYEVYECIRPIRLMAMLGIEVLCVTNAAGNVNKNFKPGDFMIIKDHISFPSLAGENPLRGSHDSRFGDRFLTMSNAYDSELISELEDASSALGLDHCLRKGCYAMVVGPTYETIAEAKALKLLGADAIGMSTVHEIIAAHQFGVRCLGVSLLTNDILIDYDSMEDIVEHEHVVDMGTRRSKDFCRLIVQFLKSVSKEIKIEPPTNGVVETSPSVTNGNSKATLIVGSDE